MLSNDSIMKPPYQINSEILRLLTGVSEKIGVVNASFLIKPSPTLRKQNQIKTIHSSLKIEGNTLSEDQITALIENKRVIGPERDIMEVRNAIEVYDKIESFRFDSEKSFLAAHKLLMKSLEKDAGSYRKKGVGIVKGSKVQHLAPPAENVAFLMKDLFKYLKTDNDVPLIKSCVFHYEVEFIHPFMDGNGRMGRLWQTVILISKFPVFQFLPFETLISANQSDYYKALSDSDKAGQSTPFIAYMLGVISLALDNVLQTKGASQSQDDRLQYFLSLKIKSFTRKDYMNVFKTLSTATASRDLKKGVELGHFSVLGMNRLTTYKVIEKKI
ncbi:Fic family protein [uncultured Imperialibacter sp.]|uniref:Fic family protein n=1 Tax=uncultured Imperialibacter sp. TaxID=1672639 RepID=UPI0030DC6707|tara:strand:+ start:9460 stop:10446 length:987 start_codon:yes stop_codon:yes gene_type:complete